MNKLFLLLIVALYVVGCSPKIASTSTSADYSEDVSAFRPTIEVDETTASESSETPDKGPYVAPSHSINSEMSVVMDSIIVNNREKTYDTYTIQVYVGNSREEANQVREKVYRVLPEEKPKLVYKQPSYKVKVGKYFDRVEAYKTFTTLRSEFPEATLVKERNYME